MKTSTTSARAMSPDQASGWRHWLPPYSQVLVTVQPSTSSKLGVAPQLLAPGTGPGEVNGHGTVNGS